VGDVEHRRVEDRLVASRPDPDVEHRPVMNVLPANPSRVAEMKRGSCMHLNRVATCADRLTPMLLPLAEQQPAELGAGQELHDALALRGVFSQSIPRP
jgi:hypothetical protein